LKIRYKDLSNGVFYFNHPFEDGNQMRLIPDINESRSLSEVSIADDMEEVKLGKGRRTAKQRYIDGDEGEDIFEMEVK
jgi:hypothetical protein